MTPRSNLVLFASVVLGLVSGSSRADAPPGRYTVANGTVYDTKTKLTWQQTAPATEYTWGASTTSGTAQNYCANLNLNSTVWRLPTMKELATLVDLSVPGPAASMDPNYFPSAPANNFWSATPYVHSSGNAWIINFAGGTPGGQTAATMADVRCVH